MSKRNFASINEFIKKTCMIADYTWRVCSKILKSWWDEDNHNLPNRDSLPENLPVAVLVYCSCVMGNLQTNWRD